MSERSEPFRFAVVSYSGARTGQEWSDIARCVERLGYSTLYVIDHVVDTRLAPIAAMSFAASATTSLRVGSLVLCNEFRHPGVLAKELATIDVLSGGGRLEVGLGAGWWQADFDALGIALPPPGRRVDRLVEATAALRSFFAGGAVTGSGPHYPMRELPARPRPPQGPPRLVIGGAGRRVLTFAATTADVVSVQASLHAGIGPAAGASASAAATRAKIGWIRTAAGERLGSIELQAPLHAVGVDRDTCARARTTLARYGLHGRAADEATVGLLAESLDEACSILTARRAAYGFSYITVPDTMIEAMAPVVAELAGR